MPFEPTRVRAAGFGLNAFEYPAQFDVSGRQGLMGEVHLRVGQESAGRRFILLGSSRGQLVVVAAQLAVRHTTAPTTPATTASNTITAAATAGR